MWRRDAVSEFICDALMWQRDAVSEIIWASTWLCSRAMRFQSIPTIWPLLTTESPVAQWLEHPTRSRRVVGSNPIWDSDFFRVHVTPRIYLILCCNFSVSNSPVPIYTPGWREALWELSVLSKNTIQCPWPGLEPGSLAPGMSALTIRPLRLPEQGRGYLFSWQMSCLVHVPCQSGKWEWKVTCPVEKSTCSGQLGGTFSSPDYIYL